MVQLHSTGAANLRCNTDYNRTIRTRCARYEACIQRHHWKILLAGLAFLGLCCLGFKSMEFENDILKLWIYSSPELTNETSYIPLHSSNHVDKASIESIIQVSRQNILSQDLLLEHLQLLRLIVRMKVVYDRRVFTLHDLCRQIHLPKMHYLDHSIRNDIESMMPCEIVTPLNCFWEGSKLLNHDNRITSSGKIDWRTFDFQIFLNTFKATWYGDFFINLLNDTGIGRGYITKPCLDITDPLCPNKNDTLNIDKALQNGCYQIAKNLYSYPKTTILGEHNRAIQSFIFIRSASDIYQTMSAGELDWSAEKVQHVVEMWQTKLRQTVISFNHKRPFMESIMYRKASFQSKRIEKSSFYILTNNSLAIALEEMYNDKTLMTKYIVAGGLVTLFVAIIFLVSDNPVRSHCWLAITGIALVISSTIAGVGLSAAIGFKFSILTTQVIPFIMLGLGLDDVLILTSRYRHYMDAYLSGDMVTDPVRQTLYNSVTIVLLSFLVKLTIAVAILFVPVPLTRILGVQILIITMFQTGATSFLYPCLLYLDSLRQQNNRIDILCCIFKGYVSDEDIDSGTSSRKQSSISMGINTSQIIFSTEFTTSSADPAPDNVRQYVEINPSKTVLLQSHVSTKPANTLCGENVPTNKKNQCCWKLRHRTSKTFLRIIAMVPVHMSIITMTIVLVGLGIYSAVSVNLGLKFETIFVRHSNEYNYVRSELAEFRMNNFDILTKDIDYTNCQELLLQLNDEMKAVDNVKVYGNGKFWLASFISWLEMLQNDFDIDMKEAFIFPNGTWTANASKNGLLAMTLLVQDHGGINYNKLSTSRLVTSHQVEPTNFYIYLSVWRSISVDFDTLPCVLYPQVIPFSLDNFLPNKEKPHPGVIRPPGKSFYETHPLQFVTCKYFHRVVDKADELSLVNAIRAITQRFSERGLATIPLGNVFSMSEQFLSLKYQVMLTVIVSVGSVFLVGCLLLNNVMAAIITCILIASNILSPFYFLTFYHLPLNAASAVMIIWSGGLGVRFSIYMIVSYMERSATESSKTATDLDDYNGRKTSCFTTPKQLQRRLRNAFRRSPCGSIVFGTLLSWVFISMTNVAFIWEHFLILPLIGLLHSLFNSYFLAPVLCFYMLPDLPILSAEITEPIPQISRTTSRHRSQARKRRRQKSSHDLNLCQMKFDNDIAADGLSTIIEESGSLRSSTKSQCSQDTGYKAYGTSCHSQELPQYIEQEIQSSLTVQYPCLSPDLVPELALKSSFTYRQQFSTGK